MFSRGANIYSEVNSIAKWTALKNYLSLMRFLILSRDADIHSEVNSIAKWTPVKNYLSVM